MAMLTVPALYFKDQTCFCKVTVKAVSCKKSPYAWSNRSFNHSITMILQNLSTIKD